MLFILPAQDIQAQRIFEGDGSTEEGFVAPPVRPRPPVPLPKTSIITETFIPWPEPPSLPVSNNAPDKNQKPPVVFTKIKTQYPEDWSATPNDLKNLLKKMQSMMKVNYVMEIKTLEELSTDPDQNPIVFRSGHYHFSFTPEERSKLRKLMLAGGLLILNTGQGSLPFYESAKKELELIFPETRIQRLGSDHPVFQSYYNLASVNYCDGVSKAGYQGNEPWFEGITINCRTMVLLSRWGMSEGWEDDEKSEYRSYKAEDAQKLGINIFAYATAQRAWAKAKADKLRVTNQEEPLTGRLCIAQMIYDGEWKTRRTGLSVLVDSFNQMTEAPAILGLREKKLSDSGISGVSILYVTGHEGFKLNAEEREQLKKYLLDGGFLFAEACCGRAGFDKGFREELGKILPQNALKLVSADSSIFHQPNKIAKSGITPALAARAGGAKTLKPELYGIEINGRLAVVYSPLGMAGGWESSQGPYAFGYNDTGALALGQNILMYALTRNAR